MNPCCTFCKKENLAPGLVRNGSLLVYKTNLKVLKVDTKILSVLSPVQIKAHKNKKIQLEEGQIKKRKQIQLVSLFEVEVYILSSPRLNQALIRYTTEMPITSYVLPISFALINFLYQKMVRVKLDWVATASGITKIIAFVISIIALTLYHRYADTVVVFISASIHTWQFCSVIAPASSFILLYLFISYLCDESSPGKCFIMELFFNLFHGLLNLIVGSIIIKYSINNRWLKMIDDEAAVKASGAMFILLFIAHLVDAFIIFKNRATNLNNLITTPSEHEGSTNEAF